jgi:hypothetical protein
VSNEVFSIKTDDLSPALTINCSYSDGTVPDFTGAAATFALRKLDNTVVINDVAAVIPAPFTDGIISYNWVSGDTTNAGSFRGEFHVTLASGKRVTFPNDRYLVVNMYKDIP